MASQSTKPLDLQQCAAFQKLSVKHQKFVLEYLKEYNGGAAYAAVYHTKPRVSASNGTRLLLNADIKAAMAEVQGLLNKGNVATAEELREFWTQIVRGNITDLVHFNESGVAFTKNSDEMNKEQSRLIKRIKVTERTIVKDGVATTDCETTLELHDPLKASELLGKSHGMFVEKQEHTFPEGITVEVVKYSE